MVHASSSLISGQLVYVLYCSDSLPNFNQTLMGVNYSTHYANFALYFSSLLSQKWTRCNKMVAFEHLIELQSLVAAFFISERPWQIKQWPKYLFSSNCSVEQQARCIWSAPSIFRLIIYTVIHPPTQIILPSPEGSPEKWHSLSDSLRLMHRTGRCSARPPGTEQPPSQC